MKHWIKANRGFIAFIVGFAIFRTAVADWNPIPSGSMRPTLLEGDVVLVDRLAYDLKVPLTDIALAHRGDPHRGDVVTFSSPLDGTRLIKRIVGLPGDVVEMHDEILRINGEVAIYTDPLPAVEDLGHGVAVRAVRSTEHIAGSTRSVQFLDSRSAARSFGPLVVPADSYFMLGDNRDNSADSRFIGVVPRRLLIGRAHRVVVSADMLGSWMPRFDRFAAPIR